MRWILMAVMACLMACGAANAGDKQAAKTGDASGVAAVKHVRKPLNNVVKMDAAGKRSALCCCGYEFTVTDNAPTLDHDGILFYMCGEGCKEMAMKATPEENAKTMEAWWKKYDGVKLADNTYAKDGKTMATCACGANFTVTDKTPYLAENGLKLYLCGEGCAEHFRAMTAAERLTPERKFVKPAVAPRASKGS